MSATTGPPRRRLMASLTTGCAVCAAQGLFISATRSRRLLAVVPRVYRRDSASAD